MLANSRQNKEISYSDALDEDPDAAEGKTMTWSTKSREMKGNKMKQNAELSPQEVIEMPLSEFESCFGFRPVDSQEKKWFAVTGKRITTLDRDAIASGIVGDDDLSDIVME